MLLLAGRTVLITVAKVQDTALRVNVIPTLAKADDKPALRTPHQYPDIATASITGPDPCPLFFDLCNTSSHTHAAPRATREFLSVWSFSA
jgi:hypothetical protein